MDEATPELPFFHLGAYHRAGEFEIQKATADKGSGRVAEVELLRTVFKRFLRCHHYEYMREQCCEDTIWCKLRSKHDEPRFSATGSAQYMSRMRR